MQIHIQMQPLLPPVDKDQWNTEVAAAVVLEVVQVLEHLLELRLHLHLHCLHHFL